MAMKFSDLPEAKKGIIGEQIVDDYLRKVGYIPYHCHENGPHPFDRLVASVDKKKIFIAEVKTKPARLYYPDTGINKKHYEEYKHIQDIYKIRVFLFFIDEKNETVYGNYLDVLDEPKMLRDEGDYQFSGEYPIEQSTNNGTIIRYFPLSSMKEIAKLDKEQIEKLSKYSTRNQEYEEAYKEKSERVTP